MTTPNKSPKITIKDVTPTNIRNAAEGYTNYYLRSLTPLHIREQAVYRASLCTPCLKAQKCLHCGCPSQKVFLSPSRKDKLNKWGKMLNKDDWKDFKDNSLNITEFITNINNDNTLRDYANHLNVFRTSSSSFSSSSN